MSATLVPTDQLFSALASESSNASPFSAPDEERVDFQRSMLRQVLCAHGISVSGLSRRTVLLEQQVTGCKKVQPDQLSRFLSGKQDLASTALYTLILALSPGIRAEYRERLERAEQAIASRLAALQPPSSRH